MRTAKHTSWLWMAAIAATGCSTGGSNERTPNKSFEPIPREATSAQLQAFNTCDDLEATLRANLAEEMRVELEQRSDDWWWGPGMAEDSASGAPSPSPDSDSGQRQEGVDYSGTNNQEDGVDEADFVKTDGYHIYTLNGARLEIMAVPEFGELEPVSSTRVEGYPFQMLFDDDRLIVFSWVYGWYLDEDDPLRELLEVENDAGYWWWRSSSLTKATVFDISDRSAPSVLRQLYLEGYYQTARKVDSSVRMVNYAWMNIEGLSYWPELPQEYYELDWEDPARDAIWAAAVQETIAANNAIIATLELDQFVPRIYERITALGSGDSITEHNFAAGGCTNFNVARDGSARGVTSILSLDLLNAEFNFEADHIVSNWAQVYASLDTLIIAEQAWDWWWFWGANDIDMATNLHRFDISQAGVTTYTGSGRVDGTIIDQFSISELDGRIRIATSDSWPWVWGDVDTTTLDSQVYVLEGSDRLEIVGETGGIGPGESIWSARFVGDKAFLVTLPIAAVQIDPLFTIDLSDPINPQVKGELEVHGVSTYIHPIANDRLLNIGLSGDENGLDWNVQVSLFDVSQFDAPALDDRQAFAPPSSDDGWSSSWSEAAWDHKAFQYWGPKQMLAIPMSTYRSFYDSQGWYGYEYSSRLQLLRVDPTDPDSLKDYGSIDHSDFFNSGSQYWWDWRDVRRSIFMGDFIYAISDRGITAHNLDTLTLSAEVQLPGTTWDELWGD